MWNVEFSHCFLCCSDKVALIEDIDAIDGRAFMLFHAFCDNEHAPFKDSIIIFTLLTPDASNVSEADVRVFQR